MIGPVYALIVAIVGAVGAVAGVSALEAGRSIGPKLTINDLRPSLPWEGLPLPRFVYTRPELLEELRRS